MINGKWKIYPLGENALYRSGDYRVTYDGLHGSFAIQYPLNERETLTFYLSPFANTVKGYDQVYCNLDACERVAADTGEALWLNLTDNLSTWESQWIGPGTRCPLARFPRFLGQMPMERFPADPDDQPSSLPENTGMTLGEVNFRSKTSSHSASYGQLLGGVVLPVLDLQPGDPWPWVHTRLGSYDGYIAQTYVQLGSEELLANAPQPVAKARKEISLKKGAGLLDGTAETLAAGTVMHVVMDDGNWLYVSVPRGEPDWIMDADGTFGSVKKGDVWQAIMLCQLDWME